MSFLIAIEVQGRKVRSILRRLLRSIYAIHSGGFVVSCSDCLLAARFSAFPHTIRVAFSCVSCVYRARSSPYRASSSCAFFCRAPYTCATVSHAILPVLLFSSSLSCVQPFFALPCSVLLSFVLLSRNQPYLRPHSLAQLCPLLPLLYAYKFLLCFTYCILSSLPLFSRSYFPAQASCSRASCSYFYFLFALFSIIFRSPDPGSFEFSCTSAHSLLLPFIFSLPILPLPFMVFEPSFSNENGCDGDNRAMVPPLGQQKLYSCTSALQE
jgi:hypothetical protein